MSGWLLGDIKVLNVLLMCSNAFLVAIGELESVKVYRGCVQMLF